MTCNADRKIRIRALMAAQPGLNYTAAKRQIDLANAADVVLASLPPSPLAALASALNTAWAITEAELIAERLAWKNAPDLVADRLRRTLIRAETARATAPSTLSRRQYRLLDNAIRKASDNLDDHLSPRDTDPYAEEMVDVRAAATGLRHVATGTGSVAARTVAAAVADLLDTLSFDFTADAIRYTPGSEFEPTAEPEPNDSARHAHLGLCELAAAADTPTGSDQDWTACSDHLRSARDHARSAAQSS